VTVGLEQSSAQRLSIQPLSTIPRKMRADHRDRDFVVAKARCQVPQAGDCLHTSRARASACYRRETPARCWRAAPSWPAGASSVMPNGMSSGLIEGRQRQAAEIEQVDEIGVGPQACY